MARVILAYRRFFGRHFPPQALSGNARHPLSIWRPQRVCVTGAIFFALCLGYQ